MYLWEKTQFELRCYRRKCLFSAQHTVFQIYKASNCGISIFGMCTKKRKKEEKKETLDRRETGMRPKIIQPLLSLKVVKSCRLREKKSGNKKERKEGKPTTEVWERARKIFCQTEEKKREAGKEFKAPPTKKEKRDKNFRVLPTPKKGRGFPTFVLYYSVFLCPKSWLFPGVAFLFSFLSASRKETRMENGIKGERYLLAALSTVQWRLWVRKHFEGVKTTSINLCPESRKIFRSLLLFPAFIFSKSPPPPFPQRFVALGSQQTKEEVGKGKPFLDLGEGGRGG